ncbi:hypothetical protein BUALT_Bualt15G0018500 [Buddleja alternifolia]|uniref:GATA transcription factor n=1 Tax=Buddleja alternifolia TaxID=168488 RepID=A0AAV6WIC4_9LAMI|nr:hypothetical protein BUALT_Bualt15G0018500 [Buddleja alternifolia]
MECIEARALKSSFLSQMAMKTSSQVFYNDDVWCLTGINSVASDDFPVEDLLNLDFPEKEFQEGCFVPEEDEDEESPKRDSNNNSSSETLSGPDEFDSLSAGELAVPVDDLENLEWLSQFVDDSTPGLSLLCPTGSFTGSNSGKRVEPVSRPVQKVRAPCFSLPVPGKARSKRSTLNKRPWSLTSPPLNAADSSSTTSSSHGSSTLPPFVFMNPVYDADLFSSVEKPAVKKQKRKPESEPGSVSGRRCTHCQVQKTPQWRTGPLGPKTLCNACGVRFKSGRLYPEYRPACSPTFSLEMHSNSHRKVLEMRRKKEVTDVVEPGLAQAVQSF